MEFKPWGKTPRLLKPMVVTEKLDGTNACVIIERTDDFSDGSDGSITEISVNDTLYLIGAQSKNRMIQPGKDNAGFAHWVYENASALVEFLGEGYHYGEWFGRGIQRGYGLEDKRFALFNTGRWGFLSDPEQAPNIPGLTVVPTLYMGEFDTEKVKDLFGDLMVNGSQAVPGFYNAEGICIFHAASGQIYKMTDNGDAHKYAVEAA